MLFLLLLNRLNAFNARSVSVTGVVRWLGSEQ
jgi:hypothetical protein